MTPNYHYRRKFDSEAQFFVNQGYVLLFPNVRGSTGYSRKFREMNINDWGGGDLRDIIKGTQYLQSLSYVDKKRIGIYGYSYGGYLTYLAVSKYPEYFKAAGSFLGMSDLLSLYDNVSNNLKYMLRFYMGDPIENKDLWQDRSPLYFMEKLNCPLLIVQAINDPRSPLQQAEILVEKLKKLKKEYQYIKMDTGHSTLGIDVKKNFLRIISTHFREKM